MGWLVSMTTQHIYWTDIESTGLVPGKDIILEVSVCVTTLDALYDSLGETHMVLGIDRIPDCDPFVRNMHSQNGLWSECLMSGLGLRELEAELLRLPGLSEKPILAGASVHFDASFLKYFCPMFGKQLHHKVLDTSAVKLFCRSLGMPELDKDPNPCHRTDEDVDSAMRALAECTVWLRKNRF